jgi:hypothetical protein
MCGANPSFYQSCIDGGNLTSIWAYNRIMTCLVKVCV